MPLFEPGERRPSLAVLVVSSDSMSGRGLFFDVRPWVFVAAAIVLLSMAIWLPFVRGLTRSIGQMTATAEQMARGQFDIEVPARRSDELGRLAVAINQLSARLGGYLGGQRRFLGDISHELNTPLARLDVALGILEGQVDDPDRELVADAQDEVRLMSQLVAGTAFGMYFIGLGFKLLFYTAFHIWKDIDFSVSNCNACSKVLKKIQLVVEVNVRRTITTA